MFLHIFIWKYLLKEIVLLILVLICFKTKFLWNCLRAPSPPTRPPVWNPLIYITPLSCLVVNVIRAEAADHHTDEGGADGNSLEVALRVVGGPFGPRVAGVSRTTQELADVVHVGVGRGASSTEEMRNIVYSVAHWRVCPFVEMFHLIRAACELLKTVRWKTKHLQKIQGDKVLPVSIVGHQHPFSHLPLHLLINDQ